MWNRDVQVLVAKLQIALGVSVRCGQITLNMHEDELKGIETRAILRGQETPTVDKVGSRSAK